MVRVREGDRKRLAVERAHAAAERARTRVGNVRAAAGHGGGGGGDGAAPTIATVAAASATNTATVDACCIIVAADHQQRRRIHRLRHLYLGHDRLRVRGEHLAQGGPRQGSRAAQL